MKFLASVLTLSSILLSGVSGGAFETKMGDWSGSGGSGFALVFTHLGHRLHREFLMQEYDSKNLQVRDQIPLNHLLYAVDHTKVISTSEKIYDRNGHEVTARYFSPDEIKEIYRQSGLSESEITEQLDDFPKGLIEVNETRFSNELHQEIGIALATVFHEYARAIGLPEDHYETTARSYDIDFFRMIQKQASSTSKSYFERAPNIVKGKVQVDGRIQVIDAELKRVKSELAEDVAKGKLVIVERRPYVDEIRKSASRLVNAYADMIGSTSMIPSISPAKTAGIVRAMAPVVSEGLSYKNKLTEFEVFQLQFGFIIENIKRNKKFYRQLDEKRQEIFLNMIK